MTNVHSRSYIDTILSLEQQVMDLSVYDTKQQKFGTLTPRPYKNNYNILQKEFKIAITISHLITAHY